MYGEEYTEEQLLEDSIVKATGADGSDMKNQVNIYRITKSGETVDELDTTKEGVYLVWLRLIEDGLYAQEQVKLTVSEKDEKIEGVEVTGTAE